MDTTAAATQAGVTVDTIRTWCRIGAISAIKKAGRWTIDAASLAYRISLAKLLRKPRPAVFTIETMTAIGGNEWIRGDKHRVYINNWATFAGLRTSHYNTGNIASATYNGEGISNSQAGKILGAVDKVYFDAADGKLHGTFGWSSPRIGRQQVWDDIVDGLRAAIAAL